MAIVSVSRTSITDEGRSRSLIAVSPAEVIGGMVLITPTSIASTGTGNSSSINANGSVTFSSCETLSLNGVFTSEYDNYMVVCRSLRGGTAVDSIYGRLRVSGTDNSTASSYVYQYVYASGTTVAGARTTDNKGYFYASGSTQRSGFSSYIYGPNLAQPTAVRTVGVSGYLDAYLEDQAFTHNQSTAYDGFTMLMGSGTTLTGLVSVYGLGG